MLKLPGADVATSPIGEVVTVPAAIRSGEPVDMLESIAEENESGVPWSVRPGLLEDTVGTVATLDGRGRPAVRLTLPAEDPRRLAAVVRAALHRSSSEASLQRSAQTRGWKSRCNTRHL